MAELQVLASAGRVVPGAHGAPQPLDLLLEGVEGAEDLLHAVGVVTRRLVGGCSLFVLALLLLHQLAGVDGALALLGQLDRQGLDHLPGGALRQAQRSQHPSMGACEAPSPCSPGPQTTLRSGFERGDIPLHPLLDVISPTEGLFLHLPPIQVIPRATHRVSRGSRGSPFTFGSCLALEGRDGGRPWAGLKVVAGWGHRLGAYHGSLGTFGTSWALQRKTRSVRARGWHDAEPGGGRTAAPPMHARREMGSPDARTRRGERGKGLGEGGVRDRQHVGGHSQEGRGGRWGRWVR